MEITRELIEHRLSALAAQIAINEAERKEASAAIVRLDHAGMALLGQQAETQFWLEILGAEQVDTGDEG